MARAILHTIWATPQSARRAGGRRRRRRRYSPQGVHLLRYNSIMQRHKNPLYFVWASMRQRCLNPKAVQFKNYGGRGITVCDRWKNFDAFIADMGPRPEG